MNLASGDESKEPRGPGEEREPGVFACDAEGFGTREGAGRVGEPAQAHVHERGLEILYRDACIAATPDEVIVSGDFVARVVETEFAVDGGMYERAWVRNGHAELAVPKRGRGLDGHSSVRVMESNGGDDETRRGECLKGVFDGFEALGFQPVVCIEQCDDVSRGLCDSLVPGGGDACFSRNAFLGNDAVRDAGGLQFRSEGGEEFDGPVGGTAVYEEVLVRASRLLEHGADGILQGALGVPADGDDGEFHGVIFCVSREP